MRSGRTSQLCRLAVLAAQSGAAASEQAAVQQRGPAAVVAAAQHALWSARVGNRQLPWHLSTHKGREQQTRLLSGSSAEGAAAAETTSSSSSSSDVKLVLQQATWEHEQPLSPLSSTSAATAEAEATAAGADNVQAAAAKQPLQQQQQPAALNFTDHYPQNLQEAAAAAAAAAAAVGSASTAGLGSPFTPQQVLQHQGDTLKPFVIPSALISLNPGDAVTLLLPLICSHILKPLAPFQLLQNPGLTGLNHQERLTMQHQRGFRVREDAFAALNMLLTRFVKSQQLREGARAAHIPKALIPQAATSFKRYMQRAITPGFLAALLLAGAQPGSSSSSSTSSSSKASSELQPSYNADVGALLLPAFLQYCQQHYQQEIAAYAAAVATLDLRSPHTWYPYARAIKRKIIYHGGPTNSGKTYNALQSLASAGRGVYCAPLRLLAMEVYETLNHRGVYCDLVTGQEVMHVPGSNHVSCTVEMANINAHVDVAVIDEIQLIGDQQRGFAWSRALLGLPANTIHVCGDTSAVTLVRHLAGLCGDDFEMHKYERMTPLKLDPRGLPNGWSDVGPGDAVVAFSRRNIYKARRAIEAATNHKACIVYGALPAETRRHQARLFNNPHSGVNVLIASDAIGLGLNFNIRRVIFTTLNKRNRGGQGTVKVPVSLIKQIGGRAGRRNSIYPEGCVTTFEPRDLPYLKSALEAPASSLYTPAAGLTPEYDTVELLSAQFPDLSLEELLKKLDSEARLDGRYFLCKQEQLLETARVLRWIPGLSLQDQFTLVNAPIDVYDDKQRAAFMDYARTYAAGQPVLFNESLMPSGPPRTEADMQEAENLHKIMGCWLWLSFRFEEGSFPGRERVQGRIRQLCDWLNTGLSNIQTMEELLTAEAAAAAQAAPAATDTTAAAAASPAAVIDSQSGSQSEGLTAAGEAAEDSGSSDVDEYSDAVFSMHVEEVPADAADRGYDGELLELDATAAAVAGSAAGEATAVDGAVETGGAEGELQSVPPESRTATSSAQGAESQPASAAAAATGEAQGGGGDGSDGDFKLSKAQLKKLKRLQAPYINWTAAVASGPVMAALSSSSSTSSSSTFTIDRGSMLEGFDGAKVDDLESLLMPEYEPSMARFVRWKLRPKFKVPPPPVPAAAAQRQRSRH